MDKKALKALKYPVGEFKMPKKHTENEIEKRIRVLESFPKKLRKEVKDLDSDKLDYRHRPGGWTISQLVHHCADSHLNGYIRTKLALTENNPTVKPYDESAWANMDDAGEAPIKWSLNLLDGLHKRWAMVFSTINAGDWKKIYFHPESKKQVTLLEQLFLYAWHAEHHLAHIKQAKKYKNKFPAI